MNSIVSQRFIQCLEQLKQDNTIRSFRQFALKVEYLPQSLSEIVKQRRDVTIELIRKAVETYNINPIYLYTGKGEPFLNENMASPVRQLTIVTDQNNQERIVHVPIPAQAGYASDMLEAGYMEELPTFSLPDFKFQRSTHRCFGIEGSSMEPTLFEGDKVVCEYVEPEFWETSLKDHYVYVIVCRGDILVKRIKNHLRINKTILLLSDNKSYPPYEKHIGELKEIWKVRVKISPFLPSPHSLRSTMEEEMQELKKKINEQSRLIKNLNLTLEHHLSKSQSSII
jgi:hypothetical protein